MVDFVFREKITVLVLLGLFCVCWSVVEVRVIVIVIYTQYFKVLTSIKCYNINRILEQKWWFSLFRVFSSLGVNTLLFLQK
jgi:hypothetical protein